MEGTILSSPDCLTTDCHLLIDLSTTSQARGRCSCQFIFDAEKVFFFGWGSCKKRNLSTALLFAVPSYA